MIKKFLIQAKQITDCENAEKTRRNTLIPIDEEEAYIFQAIDFYNWMFGNEEDRCEFLLKRNASFDKTELTEACVPVGSVEFCLEWYRRMGCGLVRPLNIPKPIWPLVRRNICESDEIPPDGKLYMAKDINVIKAPWNKRLRSDSGEDTGGKVMQFTEWRDDIESEWRLFVHMGKIRDIRRYIGEPWSPMPNRAYCETVARTYGAINPAFTLDVLVRKNGETDILELHDFFACGRYGFDDPIVYLNMLAATQRYILKTHRQKEPR